MYSEKNINKIILVPSRYITILRSINLNSNLTPRESPVKNISLKNKNNQFQFRATKMNQFSAIILILLSQISFLSCYSNTNVIKLPSLYWSSSNRLFTESNSNNYLKLNAHIGDSIDLVCPRSSLNEITNQYSIIYKVGSKYEFDNCIVNPDNYETVSLLKCDKPSSSNSVKFTLFFVKFSPVPNALEFEEDKEYFFLSASTGAKEGISQMSGGLCEKFNMKFSIKINSNTNSSLLGKLIMSKAQGEDEQGEVLRVDTEEETSQQAQVAKLNLVASKSSFSNYKSSNFFLNLAAIFVFIVILKISSN